LEGMIVFGGFGGCNAGKHSSRDSAADDKAPLTTISGRSRWRKVTATDRNRRNQ